MLCGETNHTLVFPEIIGEGQGFATVMEKYEVVHSSNYDGFFSVWSLHFRKGAGLGLLMLCVIPVSDKK